MPTLFPTSLDSFTNPTSTDRLNSGTVPHALQHANTNDAIEALQAKVGINESADTNSLDYKVAHPTAPDLSACWPVGSVFISVVGTNPATLLGFGTWSAIGAGRVLVGQDAGDADFDTLEETGGAKTVTLTGAQSGMPQHTHLQDAHGHTQNAHGHGVTDPGHTHLTQRYPTATGSSSGFTIDTSMSGTLADNTLPTKTATTGLTVNNATATNQNTTATNQNAGPTDAAQAHPNVQPFLVVCMWKRTA